ncbi:MAG: ABC-F family ATP-binding cassette domain-containing protein, partial [Candidatus Puniceispirillales bacterium]
TIDWLERKLLYLKKTMIIISHDQEFLKKIGTKTYWFHKQKIFKREGPYINFHEWSKELIEIEKSQSHKMKQKVKSETKWSIEGISARRKRNMGRVRELEKLSQDFNETKIIEKKSIDLVLNKTNESAVNVVEAFDISFAYDSNDNKKKIISNFSLKIQRNDRIGIIGANGTGKTTLIKILQGIYSPTIGRIKVGEHINLKYFDQNKESIYLDSTPWRTMTESGDYVDFKGEKIHVLSYLKKFLFDEKKSLQSNSTLSGGEKARLLLAKLFLNEHNFLILDEPTNDLDFETLNLLKQSIKNYDGTVLIISHDRFFLDHTIDRLLVFENDNKILKYVGNFSNYYEKYGLSKLRVNETESKFRQKEFKNKKSSENIIKKKLTFKETYELKILPQQIENLEKELKQLEILLSKDNLYNDDKKTFDETINLITKTKNKLSLAEEKWLQIQILNDEINK